MKIDHLEIIHLRYEYPNRHGFECAGGVCDARLTTVVVVHTDNGMTGLGSAYSHPALVDVVLRDLEPFLRGEDPCEVEALWNKMYALTRWYGRKGAALSALGAVDMALWDLRGQRHDKPIWALLGGDRPSCPAYASALLWNDADGLASEATGHLERGFRRMKMRLGRSEDYDCSAIGVVRQAIGTTHDLMVDASMRYHVELAGRMGRVLEENHVFWFEEPFLPEDLDSYVALRGTIGVPLAAGENEFGAQGFREVIRAGAVDIVQPDACRCGGITEVVRVAELAADAGLRFATHTWSDAVTVLANAQVVAARPNGLTVEIDQTGIPFIEDLLMEPLVVRDGQLQLSHQPGLGVQLNRETVERYRLHDPYAIPPGFYSDMVFGKDSFRPAGTYCENP